jgi:hypothetical protein
MDEAAPAGCVIRTRIIGAIEAEEPRMALPRTPICMETLKA